MFAHRFGDRVIKDDGRGDSSMTEVTMKKNADTRHTAHESTHNHDTDVSRDNFSTLHHRSATRRQTKSNYTKMRDT